MNDHLPSCVGLIPARQGSKRVPGKNIREFQGHPLMAYTIAAALESEVFTDVVVSTDSASIADIAQHYGAEVPFLRPESLAGDHSPDIGWIAYTLKNLADQGRVFDAFAILRPTNPFRLAQTIRRAWTQFWGDEGVDSLRAVEKCAQHPGKMWVIRGRTAPRMVPLLPYGPPEQPWHSTPYQALPEVYVQNASLEIAWTWVVFDDRTIAGVTIVPFLSQGQEGFDINQPEDWRLAEELLAAGEARLPQVCAIPYRCRRSA